MSAELAVVLSTAIPAIGLLYAAFNIGNRQGTGEKRHSVLRMFYFALGQLMFVPTVWLGGQIARDSAGNLLESANGLDYVMFAYIMIFFTYLLYVLVAYIKNVVMATTGEEFDEEF